MKSAYEMVRADSQGNPAILLSGEIDISNAAHLARDLKGSVSNLDHELILDLSRVTYIDSAGIRVMFDLARRLKDHQERLVLVVPESSGVRRSLILGGLLRAVEVLEAFPRAELETDS
ncbi:MAG: STAS domain-containing protein [Actinomycetota bacterium]